MPSPNFTSGIVVFVYPLVGLFFNDTAISKSALDPTTQELVSIFCSLLGSIIEHKRTENALSEERNLLRTLIDSLPDDVYIKDNEARHILGNVAQARIVGFDAPEQLVGKTDFDLFPQEFATRYFADDESVIRTGQPLINREERTIDKSGKQKWVLTTKVPLRNQQGVIVGLVGVTRDISELKKAQTALEQANEELEIRVQERVAELKQANIVLLAEMMERKQAEEALERERNLLRTLIDTVPANVYIKDTQSRFIDANTETALKLGGKTANDLIGKTDFEFFTPDLAEKYFADEQVIVQSGQPMFNIEEPTFDHRTGQRIWFLTTKAPVRNAQGEVTGIVGVGLDITERKQAAEAQRESERLRLALEKEKELGELKTHLMLTISHEFRTPLSVAYASSELLEKYYERMSTLQREDHLHKVEMQVTKLTGMLEEISLLIHAKFGRVALSLEPTNLKTVCETGLSQIQDFDGADERVVFHAEEPLPHPMLDVRRIQYVLTNLLSNALKYSDPATKVALDLFMRNERVIIQVTDHGIGIPSDEQAHIFEPFYRARNVGAIGGTGLGLSIVKEMVELHRGTISIQSEVNQGTQISVFLPKE